MFGGGRSPEVFDRALALHNSSSDSVNDPLSLTHSQSTTQRNSTGTRSRISYGRRVDWEAIASNVDRRNWVVYVWPEGVVNANGALPPRLQSWWWVLGRLSLVGRWRITVDSSLLWQSLGVGDGPLLTFTTRPGGHRSNLYNSNFVPRSPIHTPLYPEHFRSSLRLSATQNKSWDAEMIGGSVQVCVVDRENRVVRVDRA